MTDSGELTLIVRRSIRASPERLFEAWTTPHLLCSWWGPKGVRCTHAEVDLRVGGAYRLDHLFPDGSRVVIFGEFVRIQHPHELSYTWNVEGASEGSERVTVRFVPKGFQTEVVVTHTRIARGETKRRHREGWCDCLDRLAAFQATG